VLCAQADPQLSAAIYSSFTNYRSKISHRLCRRTSNSHFHLELAEEKCSICSKLPLSLAFKVCTLNSIEAGHSSFFSSIVRSRLSIFSLLFSNWPRKMPRGQDGAIGHSHLLSYAPIVADFVPRRCNQPKSGPSDTGHLIQVSEHHRSRPNETHKNGTSLTS
jgi:hypothetical protein